MRPSDSNRLRLWTKGRIEIAAAIKHIYSQPIETLLAKTNRLSQPIDVAPSNGN